MDEPRWRGELWDEDGFSSELPCIMFVMSSKGMQVCVYVCVDATEECRLRTTDKSPFYLRQGPDPLLPS